MIADQKPSSFSALVFLFLIIIPSLCLFYGLIGIGMQGYSLYVDKMFGKTTFKRLNMSDIYSLSYPYHIPPVYETPKFPLPTDRNNITSKVVWLYWDELDLHNAPYVVRKAIESWTYHNAPSWTIIRLNHYNLKNYIDTSLIDSKKHMSIQARSDVIRLTLLSKYGGVWADATMLCMEPLDNWIWDNLKKNGFWMYSRRCSWFMIAALDSFIAKRWYEGAMEYWSHREQVSGEVGGIINYRWMDGVMNDLLAKDEKIREEIQKIPYFGCDGVCSPSAFYADGCNYEVNQPLKVEIKKCLDDNPPYAMKLTHKRRCDKDSITETKNYQETNGHYAIYTSFNRKRENFKSQTVRKEESNLRKVNS